MRLTDLAIRNLSFTKKGQKRIRDDAMPGFGITIGTRTKTFFVMYGKERRLKTLGQWPEMSLRDARQAARRVLVEEPAKTAPEASHDLIRVFLSDCRTRLRPSTVERYAYALVKHLEVINTDTNDPNEIKALKAFFNWCIARGYAVDNPMAHKQAVFAERDRVLTDDEVAAIWRYEHSPYSTIVKLLLLTGQRRNQISSFKPEWLVDDTVVFPSSIMKSKRQHVIPITEQTQNLLLSLTPSNGWSKHKKRIDTHTGVTNWVLHDCRRYYSTTMAKLGTPLHITELLLDHRSTLSGVAAVYNRYGFLPEMKTAQVTYERHIAKITAT